MHALFQSLPAPTEAQWLETAIVGVMLGMSKVWDHRKGKKRDASNARSTDRISLQLQAVETKVDTLQGEVRDIRAFVVGPDGQNGLRSDMRRAEERLDGLENRERNQARGAYDRRGS